MWTPPRGKSDGGPMLTTPVWTLVNMAVIKAAACVRCVWPECFCLIRRLLCIWIGDSWIPKRGVWICKIHWWVSPSHWICSLAIWLSNTHTHTHWNIWFCCCCLERWGSEGTAVLSTRYSRDMRKSVCVCVRRKMPHCEDNLVPPPTPPTPTC